MVYELMSEFRLSKQQVLKEIYIRELPLILEHIKLKRARQRQKELTGYFYTLMAPMLSWVKDDDGFQRDLIESIIGELQRISDYLQGKKVDSEEGKQPDEDPFEKLKRLQGIIASTQAKKKAR